MDAPTAQKLTTSRLEDLAWDAVVGEDGNPDDYLVRTHVYSWTIETRYATDIRRVGTALLDQLDPNVYDVTVERYDSPRGFRFRVVVAESRTVAA